MPKYRKKQTKLMDYPEFKARLLKYQTENIIFPDMEKAFLSLLFFTGCRDSEALALTSEDINCTQDTIYVDFFRLKGSKQTDPFGVPNMDFLKWLCKQEGKLFPFSRYTGYRIVRKVFPELYPHYFRMNRISKISEKFGDNTVYATMGICAASIDHYRGKGKLKEVSKALREEIE